MDLTQPFQLITFIICFITICLQCYAVYLIACHSPRSMADYKRYLIISTIFELLYTADFGLVIMNEPPEFFPGAGTFIRGFIAGFGQEAIRIAAALSYFVAAFMIGSNNLCLIYRYLAVHPNHELCRKFTKLPCTVLVYGVVFVLSFCVGLAAFLVIAPQSEHKAIIESWTMKTTGVLPTNIDLETPRLLLYNNKPFIGYFFTGIGTCLVISELIYFYVVYKILMILHQNSSSFSRRSIKLHRQLTLLLAAQVLVPLLMFICPYALLLYRIRNQSMNTKFETQIGLVFFTLHFTVLSLMTIFFVTPYRKYVLDKVRHVMYPNKSITVVTTKTAAASSSNY